jgi:hypothetical protein
LLRRKQELDVDGENEWCAVVPKLKLQLQDEGGRKHERERFSPVRLRGPWEGLEWVAVPCCKAAAAAAAAHHGLVDSSYAGGPCPACDLVVELISVGRKVCPGWQSSFARRAREGNVDQIAEFYAKFYASIRTELRVVSKVVDAKTQMVQIYG